MNHLRRRALTRAALAVAMAVAHAGAAPPPAGASRVSTHRVNGIAFTCPPEYEPRAVEELGETTALLFDRELRSVLFVAAPEGRVEPAKLSAELQRAAARTVAGGEAGAFRWKRMFTPAAYNAYDKQRGEYWGYDGKLLLAFEWHKLVFPSRTVLVGYAYVISEGAQARKDMRAGLGSMMDTLTIGNSKAIARAVTRSLGAVEKHGRR